MRYDPSSGTQGSLVADSAGSSSFAVIVPSPSTVNLHDIITGAVSTLSFTLTNTGSMKAENVVIEMPFGLNFTQVPKVIGKYHI